MRTVRLCSLSLLLLLLSSCSHAPADQLKIELQTVTSWAATAHMVSEAWLKGDVPHAYAMRALRTAQETIQEEAQTAQEQKAEGVAALQSSLVGQARSLEQLIAQMRAAIEKRDGETLAQLLKQLEAEEQAIKSLDKSGGAQP